MGVIDAIFETFGSRGDEAYYGEAVSQREHALQAAYLAERGIPLEVCPTSNVCTRSVPSLAEHPLPALAAAGVPVTVNSDDPPMFATTLNHEYAVAAELLGLDAGGVAELARAGVRASFLDEAGRRRIIDEIDAYAVG